MHLNNFQLCLYVCLSVFVISLNSPQSNTDECCMSQCTVLFTVAFIMKMKGNEMGGWSEQGEGWRVEGGAQHLFSVRLMLYL